MIGFAAKTSVNFDGYCLDLGGDILQPLRSDSKLRQAPHKMLSDDKNMSNCFGFDVSARRCNPSNSK